MSQKVKSNCADKTFFVCLLVMSFSFAPIQTFGF
jgi:hypothetical protein